MPGRSRAKRSIARIEPAGERPETNIDFDAAADGYSAVRSPAATKAKWPGAGAPGQTSPG